MAAVKGGVVDLDNSTSKRQSHEITVREGYVSVVYHLHGRRHGGESWTRTTAQVRDSLTRSQLCVSSVSPPWPLSRGESWTRTTAQVRDSLTRSQLSVSSVSPPWPLSRGESSIRTTAQVRDSLTRSQLKKDMCQQCCDR
jgi:hypothetical protein